MKKYYIDTETCGLHGLPVLLQYSVDDDPEIHLYEIFREPIFQTLLLIEEICDNCVIGFNLAFDWFHINKIYNTLVVLAQRVGDTELPEDHIDELALCELESRDGPCLKPRDCFDIFLHARKTEFQSLMDRKDIRIRKVPRVLAEPLAAELHKRVPLKDIYFARRKEKLKNNWQVFPIERSDGTFDPDFCDIVLKFAPSSGLKTLAVDALELEEDKILLFTDVEIEKAYLPEEYGWAPFAALHSSSEKGWKGPNGGYLWPDVIRNHIYHWRFYTPAREYAKKDIIYTRNLYKYFGSPKPGDNDSILACQTASVRLRGYAINIDGIKKLRTAALIKATKAPKSPKAVFKYITDAMTPLERAVCRIRESTKRTFLEEMVRDMEGHSAALRAKECLDARKAMKEVEIYDKLLQAGRFHASFKVIGTLSGRMSGSDGLNPQGIKRDKYVRSQFNLALDGMELTGGDFVSFEVGIADADYNDAELRKQLCTCASCEYVCTPEEYRSKNVFCNNCGKAETKEGFIHKDIYDPKIHGVAEPPLRKFHGVFALELKPGLTYEDVIKSKGTENDWYDKGKRGGFSQLYGGNEQTLVDRIGIELEEAIKASKRFYNRYKGVSIARELVTNDFASMRQPGGIGTNVIWHEPKEYVESLTGFRRYFTLENKICKALYMLSSKLPQSWRAMETKVVRRDREQKVGGAVMSALFGAAFQVQAAVVRAATNHRIQSTGATITKELQCRLWKLQPVGVHEWHVQPMNIHDEIMCPAKPEHKPQIQLIVDSVIEDYKSLIPLIKIDWSNEMQTWADK